jgi:hypothetical protein
LSGDVGDELEVLVEVQDDVTGGLRRRGDEQVGDGRSTVVVRMVCTSIARSSARGGEYTLTSRPRTSSSSAVRASAERME